MGLDDEKAYRREMVMQVVDNQLRGGDPPETGETLDRLVKTGYSKERAKELIGCVVVSEIFDMLRERRTFDREAFVEALRNLPQLPEEEEEGRGRPSNPA